MSKMLKVFGREVLDSRGNPTVEAVVCSKKLCESAIAPSGASKGSREALELRDNDKKRFHGLGVLNALERIKLIEKAVVGLSCKNQAKVDRTMIKLDSTPNKSRLGANSMVAVSMAVARLGAKDSGLELYEFLGKLFWGGEFKNKLKIPKPFSNIINGGKHAGTKLAFQEFMITPKNTKSFKESARIVSEVYHQLKSVIKDKYGKTAVNVGDEGGFAPNIETPEEALDLIMESVEELGYSDRISLALDVAANSFFDGNSYVLNSKRISASELIDYYTELLAKYPIVSIEDPFEENDFKHFAELTRKFSGRVQVVGDDLLTTNPLIIRKAVKKRACNALLLKLNQIGTVTEALKAARIAMDAGWNIMVSHRSGETEDTFIADLSVALGCGQIKIGAPCRGERTAKFNRLLRIEEFLGKD